jgi:hypothetical protein
VVEEESVGVGSTEGQKAPEVEDDTAEEGGLSVSMKERRSKAARDRVHPSDPKTRTDGAPSTDAVMQAGEAAESRRPPPSTLTFTELHTALGEAHVVSTPVLAVRSPPSPRGSTWSGGASRVSSFLSGLLLLIFASFFVQTEVKRLTALVEEAAQKNRKLIALGSKSHPRAFPS